MPLVEISIGLGNPLSLASRPVLMRAEAVKRRDVLAGLAGSAFFAASHAAIASKGLVGVSMPTMSSLRWVYDGLGMMRALNALDYEVDLQYGNDSVGTQVQQLQAMIERGARMLVIAAIDGGALGPVLEEAGKRKVQVLAYDRLIRNSQHVGLYATFDNFAVGVMQAQDIERRLKLKSPGSHHANIELFAGSADDNNSAFFFNGAMSVLKPYIDNGTLAVGSGRTALADVCTPRWSGAAARGRLQALMTTVYAKRRIDAVLSPYDGISIELLAALKSAGYGQPSQPWPVVTGQDAELASVRSIRREEQSSTVFKDTRALALLTSGMVDSALSGRKPQVNDESTYNNGVRVVPSYLLKPVLVDLGNWHQVLVDSGYYKESQV